MPLGWLSAEKVVGVSVVIFFWCLVCSSMDNFNCTYYQH